jgi:alkylation response protein AidB-like acyl-CoA dehydrogenase
MDFELTEDQAMLRDSVARLLRDRYGFADRQTYLSAKHGWSPEIWCAYADLGLLGLGISEADGGFGGDGIDLMIVMREFGRVLATEPYFASVVLGASILSEAASSAQRSAWLAPIAAGTALVAFAHAERHARYHLSFVETTAHRDGDGWILNGEKIFARHADCADKLIVSARVAGETAEQNGLSLFLLDPHAPGISRTELVTQDRLHAAHVVLRDVRAGPAELIGASGAAYPVIEAAADLAMAALCAEAVGCMEAAYQLTVEYVKTRQQFGVVIGSFQVMQHRVADMLVMLELARSMMFEAAFMARASDAAARHRAIAMAKIQINRAGRFIGKQAIQLHGGIGTTEEYAVGHYVRRLLAIETEFGDSQYHLSQLAS